MPNTDIAQLTAEFVTRIVSLVEHGTQERIRARLAPIFIVASDKRRGPRADAPTALLLRPRRAPKQLCPVPGCKSPAAPVFGMVCAKHKDVPKAQIRKHRAERRARKEAAS